MTQFGLPFPPSTNHIWRHVRGRTFLSAAGRRFRQRVAAILRAANIQPTSGKLCCSVTVFPPDRRRRDLDNLLKSLLDAMQHGGALHDDSQIVWLLIEKAELCPPDGKVQVTLTPRQPPPRSARALADLALVALRYGVVADWLDSAQWHEHLDRRAATDILDRAQAALRRAVAQAQCPPQERLLLLQTAGVPAAAQAAEGLR